jgi:hypothetical protein
MTCASDGSDVASVACRLVLVLGSRIFFEIERKRTSSASCVRPRCDRDPRMV